MRIVFCFVIKFLLLFFTGLNMLQLTERESKEVTPFFGEKKKKLGGGHPERAESGWKINPNQQVAHSGF